MKWFNFLLKVLKKRKQTAEVRPAEFQPIEAAKLLRRVPFKQQLPKRTNI